MADAPRVVSLLDLTGAQVARVESRVGVPMDQWRTAPKGTLYPAILAELEGDDFDTLSELTMRDLIGRVTLEDADPKEPSANA